MTDLAKRAAEIAAAPHAFASADIAGVIGELAARLSRQTLPTRRPNVTTEALWHDHLITVTIGFDLDGHPMEAFATTLRGGDMQAALADACVLISIALQHGIEPSALAKSLVRVPAYRLGVETDAAASPIGTILYCIMEAE